MQFKIMKKLFYILFLTTTISFAQIEQEIMPPYHVKTVAFIQNGQNVTPIFRINDNFSLEFDDLYANEANYNYTITHCDYNWKPSELSRNEYLNGFDDQRIQDYSNSLNTLQLFSHYKLAFPNRFTSFKVSGNYVIKILNEEKEIVFSRKFILYENLVSVPIQIKRARGSEELFSKHNLDFTIKSTQIQFQNPLQNVKIKAIQNGNINYAITNIKPQYTIGNDLIYKYDKETQFWAGNEFLNFDTKDIRTPYGSISYIDTKGGTYNSHLYANYARANKIYTFFPDINGNFLIRNINGNTNFLEADYSWVYFTLDIPELFDKKEIYINGMFNDFALIPENKMEYNKTTKRYEKSIMVKQGFTNYQYVTVNSQGQIENKNAVDGNFYQTENNYTILVYYRENLQRFDRVIGKGDATSLDITN